MYGKQSHVKFSSAIHRSKGTLDYIHIDVWGPTPVPSKGGTLYFVSFIDDFFMKIWGLHVEEQSGCVRYLQVVEGYG